MLICTLIVLSYNIYIIMQKTFVIDLIFYGRFFLLVTRRCTILFNEEVVVVQEKVTWRASRLDNSFALQMWSLTIWSTIGLIWKDYLHLVIIMLSYVPFKRKQLGRHQVLINLYCSSNGKNSEF